MKVKLAICLKDAVYQERFVRCLMKHYKDRYEIHVMRETEDGMEDPGTYGAWIVDEETRSELIKSEDSEAVQKIFTLQEEDRYEEVYKIMDRIENSLQEQQTEHRKKNSGSGHIFGIYSLERQKDQLAVAECLSAILSGSKKTLLIDFQEYSGLMEGGELGLEDLLVMAETEDFVKGRILSAIGHKEKWDYVYPVGNAGCLSELKAESVQRMIGILSETFGYENIVISLGWAAMEEKNLPLLCEKIFFVTEEDLVEGHREKHWTEEFTRKERQDVLYRVERVGIPTVCSSDRDRGKLVEQWLWDNVGTCLRKKISEA